MPSYSDALPLVTLVLPVYNEAELLCENLAEILAHLETLKDRYRFEALIVNDGSRDDSGRIADELALEHEAVRVIHHPRNFGLGQGIRTGLKHARGDYIVVLDIDLSYGPHHIERMLEQMIETHAKLILASPYGPGGSVANVPLFRLFLSRAANRFLSSFSPGNFSTLTCMVRAFDARFLRGLHLRGSGMEIMPEIVRKAAILHARIEEVPAELDWARQNAFAGKRKSSMRVGRQILDTILSGFMLRPFTFLIFPGLAILVFAIYSSAWMFVHFFNAYTELVLAHKVADPSDALRIAYENNPHTYIVALLSLLLSILLFGLGLIAYQAKRYYEDLFHLGSTVYRLIAESDLYSPVNANTLTARNPLQNRASASSPLVREPVINDSQRCYSAQPVVGESCGK